jgi:hypothetical protein
MYQCQIVVTQIGATRLKNRGIARAHRLTLAPLFNVLKPDAWSVTHHGSAGGIVTIGAWIRLDKSRSRPVGNDVGLDVVLRKPSGGRSRLEPMLYSHKRVSMSSSETIYFVLPAGCDARSLPWPRASLRGQANPQPNWNQLRGSLIDIATASTAATSDRDRQSAHLRLPSGPD